jgi:subtilase family serine protease
LRLSTKTLRRAALIACVVAGAVPASAAAASTRTALPDSAPNWATPSAQVGSAPGTQTKTFWVYLKLRNSNELNQRIAAVTDPTSSSYGKYLTAAQFDARYAPTNAAVSAVSAWLKNAGFTLSSDDPSTNNRWVEASGNVAQVEKAFSTQIRTYRHEGRVLQSPDGDLSIPRSVAEDITGVTGLDGSDRLVRPQQADSTSTPDDLAGAPPSPAFVNAPPCSTYWGEKQASDQPTAYGETQPYAPCGYTPAQLQGAYGVNGAIAAGNDGSGQTVAIIDAFGAPTIRQDANQYSSLHGLPPVKFRQILPGGIENVSADDPCDPQGWYGEETLDVEAVHSMAPGANVLYVGGKDCNDESLVSAMNKIVDKEQAQIITNSYGDLGEDVPKGIQHAWDDTFRQAAIEGIGVYFSAGDNGDEVVTLGHRSTDFPADSPNVTAVGGTSLAVGQTNNYLFETGWGTSTSTLTNGTWQPDPPGDWLYGGGGGTSQLYAEPGYQKGVVPGKLAKYFGGRAGRVVPDVSDVGDPQTGMLVGQTQTFPDGSTKYSEYRIGGTSLSSPIFAGIMALADQAGGVHHGFVNPLLYSDAGSSAFRDIVDPTNQLAVVRNDFVNGVDASDGTTTKLRSLNTTGTLHTRPGFDDVTGLGSPDGQAFLDAVANPGAAKKTSKR